MVGNADYSRLPTPGLADELVRYSHLLPLIRPHLFSFLRLGYAYPQCLHQ